MNKAIVICYTGRQILETERVAIENIISNACDATQDLIITTRFDENDIAKVLLKKTAEDVNVVEEEPHKERPGQFVNINAGPLKLQTLKYIKETLHLSLKEAKDCVDKNYVFIPDNVNIYEFVAGLNAIGGSIVNPTKDFAMAQAAYFINTKYAKDMRCLIKDYLYALYRCRVNGADDEDKALVNAVSIIQNDTTLAKLMIDDTLLDAIIHLNNI